MCHLRRKLPPGSRWAISGTLLSLLVFAVASISMHFFDELLAWPSGVMGLGTIARVAGCGLMALGGWQLLRHGGHVGTRKGSR
jgi:hypothetical protein